MDHKLQQLLMGDIEDPDIQRRIGECYRKGTGTVQNQEEAVTWFCKAADQGDDTALCLLGNACFEGAGVAKDYDAAFRYYNLARDFSIRGKRYKRFFDEDGNVFIRQDFSQYPGLVDAVARGSTAAMTAMGNRAFLGIGTPTDYESAVFWYRQAAEKDDPEAQWALGYAYATGTGVARNPQKGFDWFRESARQTFIPALYNLSLCYAYGCGTGQDAALAEEYASRTGDLKKERFSQRFYTPRDYHLDCRYFYLERILEELR